MLTEITQELRKPWLTRRRYWVLMAIAALASFFAIATAVYTNLYCDRPISANSAADYFDCPVSADGYQVDFMAAAQELMTYPDGLATEENGYRLIVQHLGVAAELSADERREVFGMLGLDADQAATLSYQGAFEYLEEFTRQAKVAGAAPPVSGGNSYFVQLHDRLYKPWTLDDLPMMEEWLRQADPALDVTAEAIRMPVFCVPWPRLDHALPEGQHLAQTARLRDLSRGFVERAHFHLGHGEIDAAIDDLVSCALLGRRVQQGSLIIEKWMDSNEAFAHGVGLAEALDYQPTAEQWQRFLDELDVLPSPNSSLSALEVERLVFLNAIQSIAVHGSFPSRFQYHLEILKDREYGLDWNVILHQANENFAAVLSGTSITRPDPDAVADNFYRAERSRMVADEFSQRILDDWIDTGVVERIRSRNDASRNLMRIVIAMLIYEQKYGTLPPAYSVDDQGNPLHSWRVLLLPYLGQEELYSNIRLEEPWDSPHNQAFHTIEFPIYQNPMAALGPGMTTYTVVEGETSAFNGSEGKRLDSFGPNSADLALVVERMTPICWMHPTQEVSLADASQGIDRRPNGLGSHYEIGMLVGLRSGAVNTLSKSMPLENLVGILEGTIDESF